MAVNVMNSIQAMENMMQQAEAAKSSGGKAFSANTIVMIGDGQRAVVRPIYNMDQAIIRKMHDKFKNTDMHLSSRKDQYGNMVATPISALCAEQFGNACTYCPDAKANKLEAYDEAFIPVFLFKLEQETVKGNGQWQPVTYTNQQTGETEAVRGFRMLRLKRSSPILKVLMQTYKDTDYLCDISACDFSIIRTGSGLDTTYTCTPKPPKEMETRLREAIPARAEFEQKLLDCYEPKILVVAAPAFTLTPVQQAPTYVAANVQAAATLAPLKAQVQADMAPADHSFEF